MTRKVNQLSIFLKTRKKQIKVKNVDFFRRYKLPDYKFKIEEFSTFFQSSSLHEMGAYSRTRSSLSVTTVVGRYCSIGRNVSFMGDEHPLDRFTTNRITYGKEYSHLFLHSEFHITNKYAIIGNDVWIGENVVLKRGVIIGDGAVIASGAIVTKDVEPYAIVGGIPAKVIRYRYPKNIIETLLKLKWWKYDLKKYQISSTISIDEFIKEINLIKHEQDEFNFILL